MKPEKVGSIILPEAHRPDLTGVLWEFVKGHPPYNDRSKKKFSYGEILGMELTEGDIIQSRFPQAGIDAGNGFFMLRAEDVEMVHPWMTAEAE